MSNPSSPYCCCSRKEPVGAEHRRGFLGLLCALCALAVPTLVGIVSFLNPLRQKSQSGEFLKLATLETLPDDGTPRKVPVIADREDAWNSFPAEPIGAVFLRREGDKVSALQVVCPHAGCSIGYVTTPKGGQFLCPCHIANFDLSGKRLDATSPSPRDMDSLEVEIRNSNEVWVKFQTFGLGIAEKVAQG